MAVFKFVISDASMSYQVEKEQGDCPVLGKRIGETIDGGFLGLDGYELVLTGGSDKDGFPMMKDIEGSMRKRIIYGQKRRRRTLRGNAIAHDIVQVNCRVAKKGKKLLEEVLGKEKKAEAKEQKPVKTQEKVPETKKMTSS